MKVTVTPEEPIGTIGALIAELEAFVQANPNPSDDARQIRITTTLSGKVRSYTVISSDV